MLLQPAVVLHVDNEKYVREGGLKSQLKNTGTIPCVSYTDIHSVNLKLIKKNLITMQNLKISL